MPEALHDTITPALITIAVTHHTGVYINQVRTPHLNPHPVPAEQQ